MMLLKNIYILYNTKINNTEDKMPEITNIATNTILNAKVNNVKGQIFNHTNLATTTSTTLNAF